MKEITIPQWVEEYEPITMSQDDPPGQEGFDLEEIFSWPQMIETYNPLVDTIKPNHIWTVIEDDYGNFVIVPGKRLVNRMGYHITAEPWETDDILVGQETMNDDDDEDIEVDSEED